MRQQKEPRCVRERFLLAGLDRPGSAGSWLPACPLVATLALVLALSVVLAAAARTLAVALSFVFATAARALADPVTCDSALSAARAKITALEAEIAALKAGDPPSPSPGGCPAGFKASSKMPRWYIFKNKGHTAAKCLSNCDSSRMCNGFKHVMDKKSGKQTCYTFGAEKAKKKCGAANLCCVRSSGR